MEACAYVGAYLERLYEAEHPDLTDAARELVREQIGRDPGHFAASDHARALVAYARAHDGLMDGLARLEDLPDDEFHRRRTELFDEARTRLGQIARADEWCIDALLVGIQLADVPLDACLGDMLDLERRAHEHLMRTRPGFNPEVEGLWDAEALEGDFDPAALTVADPEVVGWLHVVESLAQGCIFTARYRAAAAYARTVMRAAGYPSLAVGTLLLALARLEDEEGFFEAARQAGGDVDDLPWFGLGRALLLYKLGQRKSAGRALRDFAMRCEGGAFFLLNPTYHDPYLPVRPPVRNPWDLAHQAVWEADGIIADTPGFTSWAESLEGIRDIAEEFGLRNGF